MAAVPVPAPLARTGTGRWGVFTGGGDLGGGLRVLPAALLKDTLRRRWTIATTKLLVTEKCSLTLRCVLFAPGFSDKDLEDILGGGEYRPDKGKGRSSDLARHPVLVKDTTPQRPGRWGSRCRGGGSVSPSGGFSLNQLLQGMLCPSAEAAGWGRTGSGDQRSADSLGIALPTGGACPSQAGESRAHAKEVSQRPRASQTSGKTAFYFEIVSLTRRC